MRKLVPIAASVLLLTTGCGELRERFGRQESGSTSLSFSLDKGNDPTAMPSLDGRILVYLVGVNGTDYTTNVELQNQADNQKSITVPNGQYKVYSVGWVGTNPVENQAYCGFGAGGNVISLTGQSTDVPITMTTSNCGFSGGNTIFADSGKTDTSNFSSISINFCNGITGTPSCTANDTTWGGNYLKFEFDIYSKSGGNYNLLGTFQHGCGLINTNDAASSKRIPPGSSAGLPKIFATRYSIHTDSSCTSAPVKSFTARDGLQNGVTSGGSASGLAISGPSGVFFVDPI